MDFFGLDIGTSAIKMVQLRRKADKYQLVVLGSAPSTVKGLLSEADADLLALAEAVKKLHRETKIRTKNVVSALPQDKVFTRIITVPKLSEEELSSALKWEAEQFVPIPLEEATLTHQIVGQTKQDGKEKTRVLLVAAPSRLINKLIKVLKTAGLNLVSLETEIFSLARSLVVPNSGAAMLVDLGAAATDLAVVENGQLVFVHSIGTGGEALTRATATGLGLESAQAEAYKKAYGVDPEKLEGKLVQVIGPLVEKIAGEMSKAIQFYYSNEGKKKISRVILTGGTAGLPEVANLLAKKLNLEIQLGDPFSRVVKDELQAKIPADRAFLYAIAVGLAMKEIK